MHQFRSSDEMVRLRALVRGRVQGVYFRDFIRNHAQRLGLIGWVRNLSDGATVEVLAEGPSTALDKLLEHLRRGPPGAYVTDVDAHWDTAEGNADLSAYGGFQVRSDGGGF